MRAPTLTCLAFALLLTAAAILAQPVSYCIKTSTLTNLRTSASLNAPIQHTIAGGTLLEVNYEGVNGNWLRVKLNGQIAWMARWVAHTRATCQSNATPVPTKLPSLQQTPTPSANVNNMCQLGWICTTELDWRRGWHAFREELPSQATATPTLASLTTVTPIPSLYSQLLTWRLPDECLLIDPSHYGESSNNIASIDCSSVRKPLARWPSFSSRYNTSVAMSTLVCGNDMPVRERVEDKTDQVFSSDPSRKVYRWTLYFEC